MVAWIGIPAFQAGCGKVIVGYGRRPMGGGVSEFSGHPERQVFSYDIAENIFTFGGGDRDILRATGTASAGTSGGQVLAPVGENLVHFMQNGRFHTLLSPCSLENEKDQSSIS